VKQKIAIIHPSFSTIGGAEKVIIEIANYWKKQGHCVCVFSKSFSKYSKERLLEYGISTHAIQLPFIDPDHQPRHIRLFGLYLAFCLKNYTLINTHNSPSNLWVHYAKKINPSIGGYWCWICHDPNKDLYANEWFNANEIQSKSLSWLRHCDKQASQHINTIISNSQYVSKILQKIYNRTPTTIYLSTISSNHRHQLIRPKRTSLFRILSISRIEEFKNVRTIIDASHLAQKNRPSIAIELNIFGDGSLKKSLECYAKQLKGAVSIVFHGFSSRAKMHDTINQCDIGVFIPLFEPMGLIPIEIAFYGIPCVGSNYGGPSEIVQHNYTGLLCNAKDPLSVAKCIQYFIDYPNQQTIMGRNAQLYAQKHYTIDTMMQKINTALKI
jgi:glycosyltransferase involved in cell wall biosynthesis